MRDVLLLLPSINKSKPVPKDDICRGMRTAVEVVLEDLPSRIGHSVALDTAMICVATLLKEVSLQLSTSTVDILEADQITLKMRNSYSVALSALQIALSHPLHSTTIETLYTVQLLCCFEVRKTLLWRKYQRTCQKADAYYSRFNIHTQIALSVTYSAFLR